MAAGGSSGAGGKIVDDFFLKIKQEVCSLPVREDCSANRPNSGTQVGVRVEGKSTEEVVDGLRVGVVECASRSVPG